MSITKAFRVLAVVLVAAFVPATALAGTPTAAAPGAEPTQTARVARAGKTIKVLKANKAQKAGKAKPGKANRGVKIVRRKAR
jgi:hypothetical protein